MLSNRERQLVCVGGAVLDRKFRLATGSVPGTSNPATVSTNSGGVARNVAENLAGLLAGRDLRVDLVSVVGSDEAGATLLAHLRARGVGVDHVRVLAGEQSAQYVAVLEPGGDLTLGLAAMDVLDQISIEQLDAAWPSAGRLFCDTNLAGTVLAHALGRARAEGTWLAVDAVSTLKVVRLPADLRGIALLSCNRDEAIAWLSAHRFDTSGDDRTLADRVRAAGAGAVLLTVGAAGVVVADPTGCQQLPAIQAGVVDVTGAGDALVAGTLAALVLGKAENSAEAGVTGGAADMSAGDEPAGDEPAGDGPAGDGPAGDGPAADGRSGLDGGFGVDNGFGVDGGLDLRAAVRLGIRVAAQTVASPYSVLPNLSSLPELALLRT